MSGTPLVWTTKGNMPIDSLVYSTTWIETETCIKLVETYMLGDEVVKQNAHVRLKGLATQVVQAKLG